MNHSISLRGREGKRTSSGGGGGNGISLPRPKFYFNSLRSQGQAELSRRLFKLIKSENEVIHAYTTAARERSSVATQLSEWGLETNDQAVDDISDKLGVILSEVGTTEDEFAQNLEDYRLVLKQIRNTEKSVQPSREHKQKLADQIGQLKYKEPNSMKIAQLEQELVRAEAENLVAEAQLTNITRQKIKEAFALQFAAQIERAEKQIILAKYGRRMLSLLDDTPLVPGENREEFSKGGEARDLLLQIEEELGNYHLDLEDIETAKLENNLMPVQSEAGIGSTTEESNTDAIVSKTEIAPLSS